MEEKRKDMDIVPQVNDSELKVLVENLKGTGAESILRLFSRWCARQLEPKNAELLNLIKTAEKLSLGKLSETRYHSINNKFRDVAAAAFTIGWKQHFGNAAMFLAVISTLNSEPSTAAEQAAKWQRRYEMLIALQNDVNIEDVEIADKMLANHQVEQLKIMSSDYTDKLGRT